MKNKNLMLILVAFGVIACQGQTPKKKETIENKEDRFKTLGKKTIIRYKNKTTTSYDRYAYLPARDIMALRHGDL